MLQIYIWYIDDFACPLSIYTSFLPCTSTRYILLIWMSDCGNRWNHSTTMICGVFKYDALHCCCCIDDDENTSTNKTPWEVHHCYHRIGNLWIISVVAVGDVCGEGDGGGKIDNKYTRKKIDFCQGSNQNCISSSANTQKWWINKIAIKLSVYWHFITVQQKKYCWFKEKNDSEWRLLLE